MLQRLGAPSAFERRGGMELTVELPRDGELFTRRFELPGVSPAAAAELEALVPAVELHHVQRASLVVYVLERAGIDVYLRSRAVRALLSFFSPYAPILVLVPPDRVAEARALLHGVLHETLAPPAVAPPPAPAPHA